MKDATLIAVLLDRSGSMNDVKDETISGFNHFLKDQQDAGGEARLTLVQFDSQGIDTLYDSASIGEVKPLDSHTYQPRGMTPLLDALGKTIIKTGEKLSSISEAERPDKVVFVVITDGLENASHEFTKARIKEMIDHQTDAYNWQFVYLGANQDAIAEGGKIGVDAAMAASFNAAQMDSAFEISSHNVRAYRRTGQRASLNYSSEQRARLMSDEPKATTR